MKIGLCTIAFSDWEIEKVLDLAAEVGFDGVEIWGKEPHTPGRFEPERVTAIRDACASRGLEITSFGSYIAPLMPEFNDLSVHALRIAQELGAGMMRIWPAHGKPGSLSGSEYDRAVAQLKGLCTRARDWAVPLAFECHDNCIAETPEAMLRLLADVGEENLKTYWQPSFRDGAGDVYASLEALLPHVVNVHAQNFHGEYSRRAQLGEGDVDYKRVLNVLESAGYGGYVEIEFVGKDDPAAWVKQDFEFLKEQTRSTSHHEGHEEREGNPGT